MKRNRCACPPEATLWRGGTHRESGYSVCFDSPVVSALGRDSAAGACGHRAETGGAFHRQKTADTPPAHPFLTPNL